MTPPVDPNDAAANTAETNTAAADAAESGAVDVTGAPAPQIEAVLRLPVVELAAPSHIHIVGVGGAGMSAIATVLRAMGHTVSGSDLKESAGLERLRAAGVTVHIGHDAANVAGAAAVATSTAIPARNPEVRAAHEAGVPVLSRAQVLAAIARHRRCLAVSGTHGKTTTSSMLSLALLGAGLRPSFIVGGELNEIGTGAVWDEGELFAVEADESDGTFLALPAEVAVVTSVEADHLDFYGSIEVIEDAFRRFLERAPGPNVVCADDPRAAALGRATGAVLYGTAADAHYRIVDPRTDRGGSTFTLVHGDEVLGEVRLPVPGLHNMRNATAAIVVALGCGASFEAAAAALGRYAGVARRFQFRGTAAGVTFVDDYAHNPGKVAALLDAARTGGWDRVVAVFQPHRYSRTADLAEEFGASFGDADLLVVTDVYAAGEAPIPGITGKTIVDAVLAQRPWGRVAWMPRRDEVVAYLRSELRPGDLCLTIGAGDITAWSDDLLAALGGPVEAGA